MPLHSLPPLATEQAALLACGERVILSHATAAAIWGLRPPSPPHVVLTAIGRDVRPRPAIEVHRTRAIDRRDVRRRHGLPVSAPARTLLDIAPTLSDRQLEKVFDEAMVSGIMRRSEARAMVERHPRHRDIQRLRALAYEDRETAWTRAVSEERLLELIRIAGLPAPEVNTSYGRYELDFFWPSERVAIEIDGERFHAHRRALERDHGRDAALQLAGIVVIRFTWRQLRDEPLAVVAQIAGALGRRAAQPSVRASAVSAMNS